MKENLLKLSKHSNYQLLHPMVTNLIGQESYSPVGKLEIERCHYINKHLDLSGLSVLDIGANTGYFSFNAIEMGAKKVVAYEGNEEHANFLKQISDLLPKNNFSVINSYFDPIKDSNNIKNDVIFCLNVLHHVGDDYGDQELLISNALNEISKQLQALSLNTKYMFFQLGFNWKGDKSNPLFPNGLKDELIKFVEESSKSFWDLIDVSVFNSKQFSKINDKNISRFDELGEFANRPIFFMESKQNID